MQYAHVYCLFKEQGQPSKLFKDQPNTKLRVSIDLKHYYREKYATSSTIFLKKNNSNVEILTDGEDLVRDGTTEYLVYISNKQGHNSETCRWLDANSGDLNMSRTVGQSDRNIETIQTRAAGASGRAMPNPVAKPRREAELRWDCPVCTTKNLPLREVCDVCITGLRPEKFVIPPNYQPTAEEREMAERAGIEDLLTMELLKEEEETRKNRPNNFRQYTDADDASINPNTEEFECLICYTEVEIGEGVVLKNCLHKFCKNCLRGHIESSEEAVVKCPFQDDEYNCGEEMQEREIATIAPEFYPRLLNRGLQVAEAQDPNSFHCLTTDCPGWCVYEDNVNDFECPVCEAKNCLTCRALHPNQNCKEYQDDLKIKAQNDVDARKNQEAIDQLIAQKEAMHCPRCKIVIMKKAGCDWILCSMCRLEICWVTRQARWGPGGNGDTSGGCKCGVKGPCHPDCTTCH